MLAPFACASTRLALLPGAEHVERAALASAKRGRHFGSRRYRHGDRRRFTRTNRALDGLSREETRGKGRGDRRSLFVRRRVGPAWDRDQIRPSLAWEPRVCPPAPRCAKREFAVVGVPRAPRSSSAFTVENGRQSACLREENPVLLGGLRALRGFAAVTCRHEVPRIDGAPQPQRSHSVNAMPSVLGDVRSAVEAFALISLVNPLE